MIIFTSFIIGTNTITGGKEMLFIFIVGINTITGEKEMLFIFIMGINTITGEKEMLFIFIVDINTITGEKEITLGAHAQQGLLCVCACLSVQIRGDFAIDFLVHFLVHISELNCLKFFSYVNGKRQVQILDHTHIS